QVDSMDMYIVYNRNKDLYWEMRERFRDFEDNRIFCTALPQKNG
ncbi:unnamed protein product, partial [Rotaria sp. Silwood1]